MLLNVLHLESQQATPRATHCECEISRYFYLLRDDRLSLQRLPTLLICHSKPASTCRYSRLIFKPWMISGPMKVEPLQAVKMANIWLAAAPHVGGTYFRYG